VEYKTKSGYIVTDEMMEEWGAACERGEYPGQTGEFIIAPVGRPRLTSDELVAVTIKLPRGVVEKLDATAKQRNETRSALIREAVGSVIASAM
jgi:hypothetical protein